jgi:UDP-glucose 4-epimerase
MKILVTGAAGYIGATTTQYLLDQGLEVIALDNLSKGRRENVPTGAEFVEGDCGDPTLIKSLKGIDGCVHFAANIEAGESMRMPEVYFENNVGTTFRLLNSLIELHVTKFVFSSSCAVYGETNLNVDESHAVRPTSPYGQSKLMVEQALIWLASQHRIRSASLRYFNAAGAIPNHAEWHNPETHLIPIALAVANGDRDQIDIFGSDYPTRDGTCIRDYVHVQDLAEAHFASLMALNKITNLTLNLGSGVGSTVNEVLFMVEQVTGSEVKVRLLDRRPGDQAVAIATNTLAKTQIGWIPKQSSLENIISDAWDGYHEPHNSRLR